MGNLKVKMRIAVFSEKSAGADILISLCRENKELVLGFAISVFSEF